MMLDLPYSHAGSGLSVVDWVPHGTGGALTLAVFKPGVVEGRRFQTLCAWENGQGPKKLPLGHCYFLAHLGWQWFSQMSFGLHLTTQIHFIGNYILQRLGQSRQSKMPEWVVGLPHHPQLTEQDLYIHTKSLKKIMLSFQHSNCAVHNAMHRPRINHLEAQKYLLTSLHSKWRISSHRSLGSSASRFQVGDRHQSKTCGVKKSVPQECQKNMRKCVCVCVSVSASHLTSKNKLTTQIVIRMCRNKKLTTTWASIEPPSDLGKKSDSHVLKIGWQIFAITQ